MICEAVKATGRWLAHLVALPAVISWYVRAPFLGGKTLRGKVDLYIALRENRLHVSVLNVYVGGLALPNAWIGGIKHRNLVEEFGDDPAVNAFAAGIENIEIEKGRLTLTVAE